MTTCANQEDYISMGYNAAKKSYDCMQLAKYIIAIELICGSQALDCYDGLKPSPGTSAVYHLTRTMIPTLKNDSPLGPYIEKVSHAVLSGHYIREVETVVGKLDF